MPNSFAYLFLTKKIAGPLWAGPLVYNALVTDAV